MIRSVIMEESKMILHFLALDIHFFFIYSVYQPILIEYLLCAKYDTCWGITVNETNKDEVI